jgi:hypothetical protein
MRRRRRPHCRAPRATARVRRGNEPRAPRLPLCACPGSPRTGHALAAHHAAAAFADQRRRRRLAVARSRSLVEVQAQSVYHLTKSLESERGANDISTSGPGVENK